MSTPTSENVTGEPSNLVLLLALTRIEGKLENVHTQSGDHELRIRSLEKARWPIASLMTLIAIGSVVVSVIHH